MLSLQSSSFLFLLAKVPTADNKPSVICPKFTCVELLRMFLCSRKLRPCECLCVHHFTASPLRKLFKFVSFSAALRHVTCAVLLLVEASFTSAANDTLTSTASVQQHSTPANCPSCKFHYSSGNSQSLQSSHLSND